MTGRTRDPGQAALMSIPFPGLGHVWCGRLGRGLAAMALVHAAQAAATACLFVRPSGWVPAAAAAAFAFAGLVVGLAVIDAARTAMSLPPDRPPGEMQRPAVYLLFVATSVAVPFACLAASGGQTPRTFRMASRSMEPSISEDDFVLLNPAVYRRRAVERGDVVMYRPDRGAALFAHRVLGLPGDTIEGGDGRIYLNGAEVPSEPEPSAGRRARRERVDGRSWVARGGFDFDPVAVPEGQVFVLGDQRDVSRDSRIDGCVRAASIVGRVDYVLASPRRSALMTAMDGTR